MYKRFRDLLNIGYPLSNRSYVVAVNNEVLKENGDSVNGQVDINTGLEPETIVILQEAGLFTKANKDIQ